MTRSVLAIVAGFVTMVVAMTIGSQFLTLLLPDGREGESGTAPTLSMILELVWTVASAILGGYVTAKIARSAQHFHSAVLAVIALILAIVLALAGGGSPIPAWFRVLLPIFSAFGILAGGLRVQAKPAPAT